MPHNIAPGFKKILPFVVPPQKLFKKKLLKKHLRQKFLTVYFLHIKLHWIKGWRLVTWSLLCDTDQLSEMLEGPEGFGQS